MDDDRKSLYFGWIATSALIAVAVAFVISGSLAEVTSADAIFDFVIIYSGVLFLWLLPFIFLRAVVSSLRERRKAKKVTKRSE